MEALFLARVWIGDIICVCVCVCELEFSRSFIGFWTFLRVRGVA